MSVPTGPAAMTAPTEQMREFTADPKEIRKMSAQPDVHPGLAQRMWGFKARLDPTVTFEEFTHWAKVERELEEVEFRRYKLNTTGQTFLGGIKGYFTSNAYEDAAKNNAGNTVVHGSNFDEKMDGEVAGDPNLGPGPIGPPSTSDASSDLDAEWRQASRALRTAGWGSIFYLITTDILGWGQTPYVFSNTGYGLGVGIFVLMGLAAGASGYMIWRTFLALDSSRFPLVTFGDVFFRLFGSKARHFINVLQSLQMFFSVAVILLGQTYILAQLAGGVNLCFIVCAIIILVVCLVSGYMRSLKHLGWFCNASVWINIVSFIIICVAAAKYGPDPVPAVNLGVLPKEWALPGQMAPVKTFAGTPPALYQPSDHDLFAAKFNGINSMVYAYSGAILFIAFLSEMRHPMDFWKAMLCAQLFISIVYIFFGAFAYSYYGQYSYVNITQVVQPLSLQILSNVLGLITGWLAVFLYFNVGMKTVYIEIGQEICGLPSITSKRGKYLWWGLGPIYWIIAFVVAMSVPQFSAFTNFIGGLFSLNFTYSFSGIMFTGYNIHEGARLPGEGYDPVTGVTTRHDSGVKRWIRGFKARWYLALPATLYALAGLATSGMGTWAAIEALIAAFGPGGSVVTSWTCTNPFAS